jgi:hypothetical protein
MVCTTEPICRENYFLFVRVKYSALHFEDNIYVGKEYYSEKKKLNKSTFRLWVLSYIACKISIVDLQ